MRNTVLVLAVLTLIVGCKASSGETERTFAPSTDQCSKDIECKGDRICEKGSCTAPGNGVATVASARTAVAASMFDISGDQADLKSGPLVISGEMGAQELRHGTRLIRQEGFLYSLIKGFNIGDKQVVLVGEAGGGTACPAMHFLIEFSAIGSSKVTDDFGTCSDEPHVKLVGEEIVITMASNDGDKTFRYVNGLLSEG